MFKKLRQALFPKKQTETVDENIRTLDALGRDADGRGTHWEISQAKTPSELLRFCIAAHNIGGIFVHVVGRQMYLDPSQVVTGYQMLKKIGGRGDIAGHVFFNLAKTMRLLDSPDVFNLLDEFDVDTAFFNGFRSAALDIRHMVFSHGHISLEARKKAQAEAEASVLLLSSYMEKSFKKAS